MVGLNADSVSALRPRVSPRPTLGDPLQGARDATGATHPDRLGNAPVGPAPLAQADDRGVTLRGGHKLGAFGRVVVIPGDGRKLRSTLQSRASPAGQGLPCIYTPTPRSPVNDAG